MGRRRKTKSQGGGCGFLLLIVVGVYVIAHLPTGGNLPPPAFPTNVAEPAPVPPDPQPVVQRREPGWRPRESTRALEPEPEPATETANRRMSPAMQKKRAIDRFQRGV